MFSENSGSWDRLTDSHSLINNKTPGFPNWISELNTKKAGDTHDGMWLHNWPFYVADMPDLVDGSHPYNYYKNSLDEVEGSWDLQRKMNSNQSKK